MLNFGYLEPNVFSISNRPKLIELVHISVFLKFVLHF